LPSQGSLEVHIGLSRSLKVVLAIQEERMASEESGNLVEKALVPVVSNYILVIMVVEMAVGASVCHVDGVLSVLVVGVRNISGVTYGGVVVTLRELVPLGLLKSPCHCNLWQRR